MKTRLFVFLTTLFCYWPAQAEYRVFVLKISKTQKDPKAPAGPFSLVESTLDPDQYRGYYMVAADEVVTYIDTWRCRGRTNEQPLCPNPRLPAPAATEAPTP